MIYRNKVSVKCFYCNRSLNKSTFWIKSSGGSCVMDYWHSTSLLLKVLLWGSPGHKYRSHMYVNCKELTDKSLKSQKCTLDWCRYKKIVFLWSSLTELIRKTSHHPNSTNHNACSFECTFKGVSLIYTRMTYSHCLCSYLSSVAPPLLHDCFTNDTNGAFSKHLILDTK